MFTFTAETEVGRDPESVSDFLTDPRRFHEWTDMRDGRLLTEGPPRVGTRLSATMGSGFLTTDMTWELAAFEPGRLVDYRTVSDGQLRMDATYRLDAQETGRTRVRVDGSVRLRGALRLLEPLLRAEIRRGEARELERAKALLEGEAASADARASAVA